MTLVAAASFDVATLILGGLLMAGALASGLVNRSFLSLTAAFVLAGFLLGDGGLGVLELDPRSGFVHDLAIVALIVILFRDGLEVEAEMLQKAWRLPLRKLVVAMPLTCVIVALADARADRPRLGGVLPARRAAVADRPGAVVLGGHEPARAARRAPLAQPRVGPQRRPRAARPCWRSSRSLAGEEDFVWWQFVLQDVTLGFAFGIAMGLLAAALMPQRAARSPTHQQSLYALGAAFATYGVAVALPPEGNGLIAVFVCAITLGHPPPRPARDVRGPRRRHRRDRQARRVRRLRLAADARRPVRRRLGRGRDRRHHAADRPPRRRSPSRCSARRLPFYLQAFMAWFGPKGVATMTFSLLVLAEGFAGDERIFNLAALCVFVSILAHGLTDTPGVQLGR